VAAITTEAVRSAKTAPVPVVLETAGLVVSPIEEVGSIVLEGEATVEAIAVDGWDEDLTTGGDEILAGAVRVWFEVEGRSVLVEFGWSPDASAAAVVVVGVETRVGGDEVLLVDEIGMEFSVAGLDSFWPVEAWVWSVGDEREVLVVAVSPGAFVVEEEEFDGL